MFINKTYRIFLLSVIIIATLFSVIGCNGYSEENKIDEENYETGTRYFKQGYYGGYLLATDYLSEVSPDSKYYHDAQEKLEIAEERMAEEDYQAGIELIENKSWHDATVSLVSLKKKKYKDSYVLYAYASAEEEITKDDFSMLMHYLEYIPDDYQGDLAEIILARKQEILENKDELKIEMETKAEIRAKERLREEAILELISFKWYKSSRSYVRAEGEVKNISDAPLRNIMAVVTYKTKDKDFITYDSALIEYNPIMPDQTSPFSVISTYNPLMEIAYLEFQSLSGEKIPHYFE